MITDKLNHANSRLKAANIGVKIEQHGNRLFLRATLPPKPGSNRVRPYQQRIALGIHANPAGVVLAEREAKKVGVLLDCKEFDWLPYLKGTAMEPETIGDWLIRFEAEHRGNVAPVTWRTDYHVPFSKLPKDQPMSFSLLKNVLQATEQDSKTRKRCYLAFTRLAQFAGLEADFGRLKGKYSASTVEPRDLPSDERITECFHLIKDPGWQWVYGMLAAFGLRGHEAFYLDVSGLENGHMVRVLEGKTGDRLVWACYPEWITAFRLNDRRLPSVRGSQHCDYTERVGKFFNRSDFGFTALDLRHRWAIRTLEFGLPYELAAKQMGHSTSVHERTYHRWITADTHQRAYDALMLRSDRPIAPQC